ncbi:MAG TPA: SusC/RagA family TonB-linked outer membrane protein [Flavisolibacter sp.]|nr:SusC/RagA family TonB-linked outer membrane protein [Flavisolibacter sp.]
MAICFFAAMFTAAGQTNQVSGTIVEQGDNSPLQGVTVTNRNTNQKTQTNNAGYFSIPAEKGHVLVLTYVGYSRQEVTVGDDKSLNIKLVSSENQIGEVVVTAYGMKQNKKDLTYQAITVDGDDIASTKRDNFINSLAGRVPGAMVTSTSGMPGASSSIILRGPTSIDGTNQPIFVVDGLIIDNSSIETENRLPGAGAGGFRNSDFGNRAMDINPEDIESLTVLKGPEATALYGSDGANGAIIITTRKGRKGRATVTYSNSFRLEKVYRLPEIQTVFDQGSLGVTNQTVRTFFGQRIPEGTQLYDNIGSFFRTGKTQIHNFSVDGGSDIATYRFTASSYDNEGMVPGTGYTRYNARLNTTFKLSPKFNVTNSFSYVNSKTDKALKGSNGFLISLLTWPADDNIQNYLDANGAKRTIRNDGSFAEDDNPFFDVFYNKNQDQNDRVNANIQLNFDPAKWVNLTAIMGVDYYTNTGIMFYHPQSNSPVNAPARGTGGAMTQFTQTQRLLNGVYRATFKKKTGNINNTLIGAFTFDSRKEQINAAKGERFYDPSFISLNNADPLTVSQLTTNMDFNRLGAFVNYNGNFKNWLILSLSARMDGSSRLVDPVNYNPSDPFYFYWSGGTRFNAFEALRLPSVINSASLRFSYATTGKDPSVPYVKGRKFSPSLTPGGGFVPNVTQGNPGLRPEFSKQLEVGAEMKFFKSRLGFDVAYYDNRTEDQLFNSRLSYASGGVLQWLNGGTAGNKGIELQLTGAPIRNSKFNWDATINFARNRNKIYEMPGDLPQFYNSDTWIGNIRNVAQVGGSIYKMAGNYIARNSRGDVLISPLTGLPVRVTGTARNTFEEVGDRESDFTVGFVNSFTFLSNWNLSFNLDIRKGGDIWNGTEYYLYTRGLSTRTLDRETPRIIKGVLQDGLENTANPTPNTIVINPLFRSDYYTSGSIDADFIEKDINWLRMRDITLNYRLGKKLLSRQKLVKNASVFCTVTDLFMITNYNGADPAVNGNNAGTRGGVGGIGMDLGNLATPRGLNFGVNVQF